MTEHEGTGRGRRRTGADDVRFVDEAVAKRTLAELAERTKLVRAELAQLRKELAQTEQIVANTPAAQLVEANGRLVLAAMRADAIAETAVRELRELTRNSQHDALTGLPKRALLLDRLRNAMAMATRHQTRLAVLFIGIDDFKRTNDTLGHEAGDTVLRLVAHRLQSVVRASDTVSRYGGDEFVVLLPELARAEDAAIIAADMKTALGKACRIGGQVVHPAASIGIALYPDDGKNPATLIRRADAAMYRAKRLGPGGFAFHADRTEPGGRAEPSPGDAPSQPGQSSTARQTGRQTHLRDLREANEQLILSALMAQDRQAEAEEAHQRQLRFLAMVTHELRNPLAPIRTAAELLARVGSDAALLKRVQGIIHHQVTHMARLLDDLLDGSRASAGGFRIERDAVEMGAIAMRAIEACQPTIEGRRQRLTTDLPTTPLWIKGDATRLAQIVSNLLDNASKYTPDGGEIRLAVAVDEQSLVITVSDNGIGLAPSALPSIFDLFTRDPQAVAHRGGGLGIGLAVVRELVDAHGGQVVARSAGEGRGSEFVVTLPLSGGEQPA